jgi:uncharacterized protein (DUF2252 family)
LTPRKTAVDRIRAFNHAREPERLALKYDAMEKDAHAFFRGTCHLFCEDGAGATLFSKSPTVWLCGDLHVGNFGTYKGDNRLVYFDIGDFDEALLGPCTWDLARLCTSLLIATMHNLKQRQSLTLCRSLLTSYAHALCDGKARWIERDTSEGLIGKLLAEVETRKRRAFIAKRTLMRSGRRQLRIDGKHTLHANAEDRRRVKRFFREYAARAQDRRFFLPIDIANRIAGTGSLGLERYTVLIQGRGRDGGEFLVDLKYGSTSALAPYIRTPQPRWKNEAQRIVAIQKRAQAISPALLEEVSIGSRSYVLRELMPTTDKIDLDEVRRKPAQLDALTRNLGRLTAWSALRSSGRAGAAAADELIAFAEASRWQRSVIEYAQHYREIVCADWKQYREAYRDGAFPL